MLPVVDVAVRDAPLQLYNGLHRAVEEFKPILPGRVRLYTCGLTVYNYAHLGNLRAYLFTDTLRRVLEWKGYDVLHVMNITDVGHLTSDADEGDDKVESAAQKTGRSVWQITEHYTRDFQDNLKRLHILEPSIWCKATDHIQEMIAFARRLQEHGYTYDLPDGLYFDTSKVPEYGALGALDLEGQKEGARVEAVAGKRQPWDFCLWRASPSDKQRLMEWSSPWGKGAPGWHLECSVMSLKYLGAPFDIHTGGVDHKTVHHVNEIAQNQAYLDSAHGGVNFWMHNEFLLLNEEKMSKSSGDFLRLQTLLDWGIHPLVYRFFNLQTHYRSQLAFSLDGLIAARTGLERFLRRAQQLRDKEPAAAALVAVLNEARYGRGASYSFLIDELTRGLKKSASALVGELDAALSDDLATPRAIALLGQVLGTGDGLSGEERLRLVAVLDLALGLGLLDVTPADLNLKPASAALSEAEIEALLQGRRDARKAKDFARADEIRKDLEQKGVTVEDGPGGVTLWSWTPRR